MFMNIVLSSIVVAPLSNRSEKTLVVTKPLPASTAFLRFSLLVQKFIFLQDYSIISMVYNSPISEASRSYE